MATTSPSKRCKTEGARASSQSTTSGSPGATNGSDTTVVLVEDVTTPNPAGATGLERVKPDTLSRYEKSASALRFHGPKAGQLPMCESDCDDDKAMALLNRAHYSLSVTNYALPDAYWRPDALRAVLEQALSLLKANRSDVRNHLHKYNLPETCTKEDIRLQVEDPAHWNEVWPLISPKNMVAAFTQARHDTHDSDTVARVLQITRTVVSRALYSCKDWFCCPRCKYGSFGETLDPVNINDKHVKCPECDHWMENRFYYQDREPNDRLALRREKHLVTPRAAIQLARKLEMALRDVRSGYHSLEYCHIALTRYVHVWINPRDLYQCTTLQDIADSVSCNVWDFVKDHGGVPKDRNYFKVDLIYTLIKEITHHSKRRNRDLTLNLIQNDVHIEDPCLKWHTLHTSLSPIYKWRCAWCFQLTPFDPENDQRSACIHCGGYTCHDHTHARVQSFIHHIPYIHGCKI